MGCFGEEVVHSILSRKESCRGCCCCLFHCCKACSYNLVMGTWLQIEWYYNVCYTCPSFGPSFGPLQYFPQYARQTQTVACVAKIVIPMTEMKTTMRVVSLKVSLGFCQPCKHVRLLATLQVDARPRLLQIHITHAQVSQ